MSVGTARERRHATLETLAEMIATRMRGLAPRWRSRSLWFLVLAALLCPGGWRAVAARELGGGPVAVIDGDTLQVGDHLIQLYGIDAPELGQMCNVDGTWRPCGVEAALALGKLLTLANGSLDCSPWQDDSEGGEMAGATVAVCQNSDQDVALVMLHGGYSVALPGSFPDYADTQEEAREAGLGVWHSKFVLPWKWRQGERLKGEKDDCIVKGVINDRGERVYYVPTDPDYDGIATDPARGDARFCSDEEARAAGWRRPGEAAMVD